MEQEMNLLHGTIIAWAFTVASLSFKQMYRQNDVELLDNFLFMTD